MPDEIKPVDAQADNIDSANVKPSVPVKDIEQVLTDEKGNPVKISSEFLEVENLHKMDAATFYKVTSAKEINEASNCKNCKFWKPTSYRPNTDGSLFPINGLCRVNPPEAASITTPAGFYQLDSLTAKGFFPEISPFEWCGKYEKLS
jgi:hypothetical protein